jgi:hypothetical protein
MEALHDSQPQDADTDLDYAAAAAAGTSGQTGLMPRSAAPAARRDEVQRLFCSVLVVRWDLNTPYAAPVIIMSQEGSNIYQVLERHLRRDYLVGAEKFWRLVRAELGVDTWRPRVQGAQLKALQSARLPESEQEFQNIQLVVEGLQDCLLPESSTDALMQDLRTTISQIQAWWETRNKRPDGAYGYARLGGARGGRTCAELCCVVSSGSCRGAQHTSRAADSLAAGSSMPALSSKAAHVTALRVYVGVSVLGVCRQLQADRAHTSGRKLPAAAAAQQTARCAACCGTVCILWGGAGSRRHTASLSMQPACGQLRSICLR